MSDKIFADGIRFERPRDGAPEFVKGKLSFFVEDAVKFLEANKNEKGWVNLDLLVSKKEGKPLYLQLDNYKPEVKQKEDEIKSDDIPF